MRLLGKQSGKEFNFLSPIWHGEDFELLDLETDIKFDPSKIDVKHSGLWRYKSFLPETCNSSMISLGEGFTPIIKLKNNFGLNINIKLDHLNPSGSYKDRGASVLISHIKTIGIQDIIQDSSGNAGAAIAAYAAAAKINCKIFLPKETPESKILQMKAYGAKIIMVNGNREMAAQQAFDEAKNSYYASHCFNPFFFQGTKTFIYEAFEQMNEKIPDYVILPAGNGTLIIGAFIAFKEFLDAGIIQKLPKIIAVQTEACNPLELAFKSGDKNIKPIQKKYTLAEGIAIANPVRAIDILNCISESNGGIISVSEDEILQAWKNMSSEGHLIESTSAATIAGLMKILPNLNTKDIVLSLFSGNGLKSLDKMKALSAEKIQ
jgi:threonine synthase